MWEVHKDKYWSIREALEEQYPDVLKEDRELELAVLQIKALEALIDKKMIERDEQNEEDNG